MPRLSIVSARALLVAAVLAATSANAGSAPSQTGALVLFGASWCPPCIAELRDLRRVAEAAAPDRVVIVWEGDDLARFDLPIIANVDVPAAEYAHRLLADSAARRGGLPYAEMVSGSGVRCAEHQGRVSPEMVQRMKQDCAVGRGGTH